MAWEDPRLTVTEQVAKIKEDIFLFLLIATAYT